MQSTTSSLCQRSIEETLLDRIINAKAGDKFQHPFTVRKASANWERTKMKLSEISMCNRKIERSARF